VDDQMPRIWYLAELGDILESTVMKKWEKYYKPSLTENLKRQAELKTKIASSINGPLTRDGPRYQRYLNDELKSVTLDIINDGPQTSDYLKLETKFKKRALFIINNLITKKEVVDDGLYYGGGDHYSYIRYKWFDVFVVLLKKIRTLSGDPFFGIESIYSNLELRPFLIETIKDNLDAINAYSDNTEEDQTDDVLLKLLDVEPALAEQNRKILLESGVLLSVIEQRERDGKMVHPYT